MNISAKQLFDQHSNHFESIFGDETANVNSVLPPSMTQRHVLSFVSDKTQLEQAIQKEASIIIALKKIITEPPQLKAQQALLTCDHVQLTMTSVLKHFDRKQKRLHSETKIHPSASIHPSAQIGQNVQIGPHVFIGEDVQIGDNSFIGANTVIEANALIGQNTVLHPLVFIGAYCVIGNSCEIHPHTTIGSDGYGYASDKNGHHKIPQIGNVHIEDFVEIGSNCAIDRATLTSTKIGMGTKLDNLCHIAHNVQIGKGCFVTAMFSVAGSTEIGDFCVFAGRSAAGPHIKIADKTVLAGNSIALADITEAGGQYGGFPIQPMKDYLRTQANLLHLTNMRKQLNKVLKHLGLEEQ